MLHFTGLSSKLSWPNISQRKTNSETQQEESLVSFAMNVDGASAPNLKYVGSGDKQQTVLDVAPGCVIR